jgi:hypothetical protein
MLRYSAVVVSMVMLGLTFNEPNSQWPVDFALFGYSLQGNAFGWLFTVCLLAFIPLLLISVAQLIRYGAHFFRLRNASNLWPLLLFAFLPLCALARFNAWIFSEIF